MKPSKQPSRATYQYYPALCNAVGLRLQLQSLNDLIRYAEQYCIKSIFLLEESNEPFFAIVHQGSTVLQKTDGYDSLEDYITAKTWGFADAGTYYKAREEGYERYEDYRLVHEIGVPDTDTYDALKASGFVAGFDQYTTLITSPQDEAVPLPDIGPFSNAYELYCFAKEAGFEDYEQFIRIFKTGFTSAGAYHIARERGFADKHTYDDAVARNIATYEDYKFANEHHLRDHADALKFIELENMGDEKLAHDERILLALLSMMEEGKRISINKLSELFRKATSKYADEATGELPVWFRAGIADGEGLVTYLANADVVRQYGQWDRDGEFFEIARLQARSVVIDGSNVAYNTQKGKTAIPLAANILKMICFLRKKGFEEITVIADASLRHKITDGEKIEAISQSVTYFEAPVATPADVFLIQYVKNHRCLLVTNDGFREWKIRDPWVAEYMDYYRLTFLLQDEEILMPDLK